MNENQEELFDLFVAHGTTVQEIAAMRPLEVAFQIAELRAVEPYEIRLTHIEIANRISDYAKDCVEERASES